MRKDRSCSAGLLEFSTSSSPDSVRKNKSKSKERKKEKLPSSHGSSSKLRSTPHALLDLTVFHIPGMDVKVQYQSKVKNIKFICTCKWMYNQY